MRAYAGAGRAGDCAPRARVPYQPGVRERPRAGYLAVPVSKHLGLPAIEPYPVQLDRAGAVRQEKSDAESGAQRGPESIAVPAVSFSGGELPSAPATQSALRLRSPLLPTGTTT